MNLTRRKFLQIAGGFGVSAGIPGAVEVGYATRIEPLRVATEEFTIRIPRLPTAFEGFRISLFSDIHLYPFTQLSRTQSGWPIFSGLRPHSHGGQVRLPVLGPLILPPMGEIYNMGLYRVGNAQLYTTRGIGTIHVKARLNCPPEVTAITLQA